MTSITFNASVVHCEENDGVIVVGFADDQLATSQYVVLQRTLHPSQQDLELKLDGLHVEVNGSENSAYDAIDSIRLKRDEAEISLESKLSSKTGYENVKVLFNIDDHQFLLLQKMLLQLVGNRTKLIL